MATVLRRVPIRILSLLAAILVCTSLLNASLHLEASTLNGDDSPDLDISSKKYASLQQQSITPSTLNQVNNATALFQNKAAAWEFSSNETALLSRSMPVFRSIWHEIQGQGCQKRIRNRLDRLQRHVNSLDIYVVSHGGVGSNAIIDYIDTNTTYRSKSDDDESYRQSCHIG
jgi:hypothetical protein